LETTPSGEMPLDVYQKLADDRILFITDHINDMIATDIIATLLLKDHENSEEKITLFINSSGGDIRNILSIYDVMQMISAPIETICIGSAMDESVILLAGGEKGMRFATVNSSISVSQLFQEWMTHTNITDGKNLLDQLISDNNKVLGILAKSTGKRVTQIRKDFGRKVFFNAAQALKYNIIDKVIQPHHDTTTTK
jgi:ATP-dependent Clp protease protease subunit